MIGPSTQFCSSHWPSLASRSSFLSYMVSSSLLIRFRVAAWLL